MDLAGQGNPEHVGQRGYAMAALLIALSIMAIMMTVVMPVWKQTARREKEEELVFRGKQYVHAIGLYQKKVANTFPANIDLLVEQRFLRKKFKDPITNDDFVPIPVGGSIPGQAAPAAGQRGGAGASGPGSTGASGPSGSTSPGAAQSGAGRSGGPPASSVTSPGQSAAGIMGVTSKSKEQSIRLYNGRGHYNEWAFLFVQQQQAGGGTAPGTSGGRGQPGQPPGGVNPGGRGTPGQGRGRGPGGGPNGPFGPNGPGRGTGGVGTFGNGGVTPILPPTRGRL